MCEKHYCTHSPETLCSCAPVQSGDVAQIVFHMAENMEDIRWELDYKSLGDLSGHRLCAVGKCRQCGGRLCAGQYPVDAQTPEDFLRQCTGSSINSIDGSMPLSPIRLFVKDLRRCSMRKTDRL